MKCNLKLFMAWNKLRKKKIVALHPKGHFKGYHFSSGPGGALATGGEGEGAPLRGDCPGDHLPGARGRHLSS